LNSFPLPAASTATPYTKIGDAPRSSLNLWGPSKYNLDMAIQRTFPIYKERMRFVFRADCFDVTNKVTFSLPQSQTVAATVTGVQPGTPVTAAQAPAFGQLTSFSGNRKWQFSGRIQF
jgi:hypothetical protein